MPMYKKSLLVLLFIALITSVGIFYNYTDENITLEETTPEQTTLINDYTDENINEVTVYVTGEVNSPGIVKLTAKDRIHEAIVACGDFTPLADKSSINLAQKLEDGMQIKVSAIDTNIKNDVANSNNNKNTTIKQDDIININTATKEELDTLPGIGPAMADRIIEYRQANGNFKTIEDIKNVRGIGEAKFSKMQDRITI